MQKLKTSFRKLFYKESLDIGNVLNYYRYGSLLITSIFYFGGPPAASWFLKLGVSLCLLLEALVFIRIFQANGGKLIRKTLVIIETVGLALILVITGGLDSPFLWYAINPILVAATMLPFYYCWSMAATFLALAFTLHSFRLYSPEIAAPLFPERSNFILIFILITLVAQLFNHLIGKLSRQTGIMKKQLQHINALYEAIEALLLTEEKDRIAGEIHDKVTQNIFGLVYGMDLLIRQDILSEPARQRVLIMQKTAQQCQRDLRDSIYNMSSLKSNTISFTDEIRGYLYNLGQLNDVNIEFACSGIFHRIKPAARSALYRIIREATANSIRHGFCRNIQVIMDSENGRIKLTIADDGCGFDQSAVESSGRSGLGLSNMKEQAAVVGGKLLISSSPGRGTRIYLETMGEREQNHGFSQEGLVICGS